MCVNKFSHKEALSFARQAVKKLEEIIESPIFDSKESQQNQNIISTTVIAYYNVGVELEHLQLWKEAQQSHEKALQLSKMQGDVNEIIVERVTKALQYVNMKVRNKVQLKYETDLQQFKPTSSDQRDKTRAQRQFNLLTPLNGQGPTLLSRKPPSQQNQSKFDKDAPLSLQQILNKLETESIQLASDRYLSSQHYCSSQQSSRHNHSQQQKFLDRRNRNRDMSQHLTTDTIQIQNSFGFPLVSEQAVHLPNEQSFYPQSQQSYFASKRQSDGNSTFIQIENQKQSQSVNKTRPKNPWSQANRNRNITPANQDLNFNFQFDCLQLERAGQSEGFKYNVLNKRYQHNFMNNFTPRPSGVYPLSSSAQPWECAHIKHALKSHLSQFNLKQRLIPNPGRTYLGTVLPKTTRNSNSRSPQRRQTATTTLQTLQPKTTSSSQRSQLQEEQTSFIGELERWKQWREQQIRTNQEEMSFAAQNHQIQQLKGIDYNKSQRDEKDNKHRPSKKKAPQITQNQTQERKEDEQVHVELQSPQTITYFGQEIGSPMSAQEQTPTEIDQTPEIRQTAKFQLENGKTSPISSISNHTQVQNYSSNIVQKSVEINQFKKPQFTPILQSAKNKAPRLSQYEKRDMKITNQASEFSQITEVGRQISPNLVQGQLNERQSVATSQITQKIQSPQHRKNQPSNERQSLAMSQITSKTIELTPNFQMTQQPDRNIFLEKEGVDRIGTITTKIKGLNLQLNQFQQQLDQQKEDPILQSTSRTGASNKIYGSPGNDIEFGETRNFVISGLSEGRLRSQQGKRLQTKANQKSENLSLISVMSPTQDN